MSLRKVWLDTKRRFKGYQGLGRTPEIFQGDPSVGMGLKIIRFNSKRRLKGNNGRHVAVKDHKDVSAVEMITRDSRIDAYCVPNPLYGDVISPHLVGYNPREMEGVSTTRIYR